MVGASHAIFPQDRGGRPQEPGYISEGGNPAFALGVVVLKRFSVKEVVTWGGQKETQRDLGSVVVVEDGFPKIILEVAYVISQLEMMATLFRGELNSP